MAIRLLFYWWAHSLFVFTAVTQFLLAAMFAWAAATLFGTKLLGWVFQKQAPEEGDLA